MVEKVKCAHRQNVSLCGAGDSVLDELRQFLVGHKLVEEGLEGDELCHLSGVLPPDSHQVDHRHQQVVTDTLHTNPTSPSAVTDTLHISSVRYPAHQPHINKSVRYAAHQHRQWQIPCTSPSAMTDTLQINPTSPSAVTDTLHIQISYTSKEKANEADELSKPGTPQRKGQGGRWTLQISYTSKEKANEADELSKPGTLQRKGQGGRFTLQTIHTSKERPGRQTNAPNQAIVAFTKARRAMKAMRLAAMLATSAMDCEAPAAAASSKFLCCLKVKHTNLLLHRYHQVPVLSETH